MVSELMEVLVTFIIVTFLVLLALRVVAVLLELPVVLSVAGLGLGIAIWRTATRNR